MYGTFYLIIIFPRGLCCCCLGIIRSTQMLLHWFSFHQGRSQSPPKLPVIVTTKEYTTALNAHNTFSHWDINYATSFQKDLLISPFSFTSHLFSNHSPLLPLPHIHIFLTTKEMKHFSQTLQFKLSVSACKYAMLCNLDTHTYLLLSNADSWLHNK